MKTSVSPAGFFSLKTLAFLTASVFAVLFLTACYEPPAASHGFTGIAGDHIGDDYVYYPSYEVYYVPTRSEYIYYDGTAWVRTTKPTQAWARDISGAPYVNMTFHDAPEHHHTEIKRAYPKNWVPPEAVPGVPARTANDDVREGKK
ncbi:MAG: hypothetical protein WDM96_03675 [Lacunisphaera sp.]